MYISTQIILYPQTIMPHRLSLLCSTDIRNRIEGYITWIQYCQNSGQQIIMLYISKIKNKSNLVDKFCWSYLLYDFTFCHGTIQYNAITLIAQSWKVVHINSWKTFTPGFDVSAISSLFSSIWVNIDCTITAVNYTKVLGTWPFDPYLICWHHFQLITGVQHSAE